MANPVIVRERPQDQGGGKYTQDVITPRHQLLADEPVSYGSADLGPTPYEYLCAALGACTTITMRAYIAQGLASRPSGLRSHTQESLKWRSAAQRCVYSRDHYHGRY